VVEEEPGLVCLGWVIGAFGMSRTDKHSGWICFHLHSIYSTNEFI
jgi:hypothetical protein